MAVDDAGVAAFSGEGGAFAQSSFSPGGMPGPGVWQRTGERLCYDEVLADSRACGSYTLVCLKDDGAPERLATGMLSSAVPAYGGSSGPNMLRLGFPPEAELCCAGCGSRVLFGRPEWLQPLVELEQEKLGLPLEVRPDGQGGFLLGYPNTQRWVTHEGAVKPLSTSGTLPLATVGEGEVVVPLAVDAVAGLELRDEQGKVVKQLHLGPGFFLRDDGFSPERALAFMGDGTGLSLWRRPLPDGLQEELYVLGTGWRLEDSWLYRYPSLVRSTDAVWLVAEPHGRHVYLVDFAVGRVVALVR
jgi:hypothetical protein